MNEETTIIIIPENILELTIDRVLKLPRGLQIDFFMDFRWCFAEILSDVFKNHGIVLDPYQKPKHQKYDPYYYKLKDATGRSEKETKWQFYSGYNYDEHSFSSLNNHKIRHLFDEARSFKTLLELETLGSFQFVMYSEKPHISIVSSTTVVISGYFYNFSDTMKTPWCSILNVSPKFKKLESMYRKLKQEVATISDGWLSECKGPSYLMQMPTFNHRITGEHFCCRCFEFDENVSDIVASRFFSRKLPVKEGICSLCTGRIPRYFEHYCDVSEFVAWYYGYIKMLKINNVSNAENHIREVFGYPQKGATRLFETYIYKIVCEIFEGYEVIRNYRGKEIEYLELDIWVPAVKLGIEYQGQQHYKPVGHWGGRDGLKKRQKNDNRKKQLCKELEYHLVEFTAKERKKIDYQFVLNRIRRYHPFSKKFPDLSA